MLRQNLEPVVQPTFKEEVIPNVVISAKTEFMLLELKKMFYNEPHPDVGCNLEKE